MENLKMFTLCFKNLSIKMKPWACKVAQQGKALVVAAWQPAPGTCINKGGRREMAPDSTPLTSMHSLWTLWTPPHTHTHAHTHTHTHTHIHTHTRIHMHTHTYTRIHTHMHTYTHTHTRTYTRIHTHTHTHTYTRIHTRTHTHTHAYTHTRSYHTLIPYCTSHLP
jgi:hypothetical protein